MWDGIVELSLRISFEWMEVKVRRIERTLKKMGSDAMWGGGALQWYSNYGTGRPILQFSRWRFQWTPVD
jgi:hypothetical protein